MVGNTAGSRRDRRRVRASGRGRGAQGRTAESGRTEGAGMDRWISRIIKLDLGELEVVAYLPTHTPIHYVQVVVHGARARLLSYSTVRV